MSTLFSDDFNRANGGLGGNYTDLIAGMAISSNQVAGIAGDAATYYSGGTPGANCWAQIKFATKTAGGGNLGIRLNTGTFDTYFFSALTGSASISRQDAGVPTVLGSTFTTPADGTVVRLEMRGSTISVYYDDVLQTTRTDATYSSAGRTFFSCNGAAHRYDDFSTGTLPTISGAEVPNTSTTTLRIRCATDDSSGTLYVVADTASLSGITASQIKAGQNASSVAATASGNVSVSGSAPDLTLTGLSAGTSYNVAVLQFSGGNSNILTLTVSTQAATGAGDSSGPGLVIGDEAGFVGEGAVGAPNVAGGPVTYDVSISEATSAADAFASVATFARSVAEAVALADTPVGLGVFPRALAESVTPTDAMTGGSAFASSLAESITPTYAPSLAYATNPSLAESLTTLDTVASALQAVAALTEAVAATDAPTAARVTAPSLTEAVSAADTFTGGLALLASLSESTAVADTVASILAAVGALAESFTITDTQNADQAGVISVSMSESFTASDAVASALNALNALTETLTLSETVARAWITTAGLAESVTPTDLVSATRALAAGLTEAATLVDSVSSIGVFSVQIAEAAALIDAPQAAALLSAALGEAITPTDIVAAIAASYPGDPRRTFTVSGGRGLVVQAGDRVVVVTRNDRTVH